MLKKAAIGCVVLVCALGAWGYFLLNNLDYFVKAAIEKYGSAIAGVTVKVGNAHISPSTGEGSISDLTVSNPRGFDAPYAYQIGKIALAVDTGSLFGNGTVIIRNIAVENPQVTFEVNGNAASNLQAILQHVKDASGKNMPEAPHPSESSGDAAPDHKPARKIIIRDLTVSGGRIHITDTMLRGKVLTAPLSTIHLTDIGKDSDGVSPEQAVKQVLAGVMPTAMNDAEAQLPSQLAPLKNITDKLKGLFR